jgi:hypothetical protein
LTKAEEILRKCFNQLKNTIGLDNPITLNIMMTLATVLGQQAKTLDAQKLLQETFERQKKILGGKHYYLLLMLLLLLLLLLL